MTSRLLLTLILVSATLPAHSGELESNAAPAIQAGSDAGDAAAKTSAIWSVKRDKASAERLASLKDLSDKVAGSPDAATAALNAYYDKSAAAATAAAPVTAGSTSKKPLKTAAKPRAAKKTVPQLTLKQLTTLPPSYRSVYDAVVDADIPTPSSISERVATAIVAPKLVEPELGEETAQPQAQPKSKIKWDLQVFTGDSVDAPTPLTIHQNGQPDIHVGAADYYTSPWSQYAPYYAWRVGRWDGDDAWEFEHIHNKMFLSNLPPDVQQFQLTHGYNYILINRAHKAWGFIWRVGAGAIVTHPEIIVRGQSLSQDSGGIGGGYFLCGVGAQGAVEKRLYFSDHVYGSLEAKITAGYADVPIVNGDAQVPALTLHGLFGIGAEF